MCTRYLRRERGKETLSEGPFHNLSMNEGDRLGRIQWGWNGRGENLVDILKENMTNGFGDKLCKGDERRVSLLVSKGFSTMICNIPFCSGNS